MLFYKLRSFLTAETDFYLFIFRECGEVVERGYLKLIITEHNTINYIKCLFLLNMLTHLYNGTYGISAMSCFTAHTGIIHAIEKDNDSGHDLFSINCFVQAVTLNED